MSVQSRLTQASGKVRRQSAVCALTASLVTRIASLQTGMRYIFYIFFGNSHITVSRRLDLNKNVVRKDRLVRVQHPRGQHYQGKWSGRYLPPWSEYGILHGTLYGSPGREGRERGVETKKMINM